MACNVLYRCAIYSEIRKRMFYSPQMDLALIIDGLTKTDISFNICST